ncbi:MAG: ABC transporter substrate-binding protein [Gemmatimonadaceae bacterium]
MRHRVGQLARIGSVAAIAAAFASACAERSPYRIGVVLGSEGLLGARLAVESVNAAGGVDGHLLQLRDLGGASSGSAQVALAVAESLATDSGVLAVVGHANSSASLAASQVYNARHIVQIAPTTTTPLYSQAGPYSFRLVSSDEFQARYLADIVAAAKPARITVAYVNDDYGRALQRLVHAELERRGVKDVREVPYVEEGSGDPLELARVITLEKPTVLLWLGRATFFAQIARPLRAALPALDIVASDGFGGARVQGDSGRIYGGIRHVRLVNLERADTALQAVQSRYRIRASSELTDDAALAYDAVMLLAQAIREGGADRDAIRTWMSKLGSDHAAANGITGPIAFSASGDRAPLYVLDTVRPGAARAPR